MKFNFIKQSNKDIKGFRFTSEEGGVLVLKTPQGGYVSMSLDGEGLAGVGSNFNTTLDYWSVAASTIHYYYAGDKVVIEL